MDIKNMKNTLNFSGTLLFLWLFFLATIIPVQADVTVTVSGPGGQVSQALPDAGGAFDVDLPLNRNAVNAITVHGNGCHGQYRRSRTYGHSGLFGADRGLSSDHRETFGRRD